MLPFDAPLSAYAAQAGELLESLRSSESSDERTAALKLISRCHPRFLDEKVAWLPKNVSESDIRDAGLGLADMQLVVARSYNFQDWAALTQYAEAVPLFDYAAEHVINGDLHALKTMLQEHPDLVLTRSARVCNFDPPMHRATLLHYVAANGVESYRQRTPKNAVAIAKALLEAGAEPDAPADMYGEATTTMKMLVSSCHPAKAGVQAALVETLIDAGATVEGCIMTALIFGYRDAAEALVRRGARVDNIAAAAGLGRLEDTKRLLPLSDADSRHRAIALAAQLGHADVVRLLLDSGEDPNRYNPKGHHAHATPLHHAALAGHLDVVRLLVERGARLDAEDTLWHSTPREWAEYQNQQEVAMFLRLAASN